MDAGAVSVLKTLHDAGYEAYFVGGCVRDTLLGREINDCDVATSALPEEVTALFSHTVPTGIRHGTVTVLNGSGAFEVTTFRTDGGYRDHRHPSEVRFVRTLEGDLARRDFTVNAMAMDENGRVTDLFGGREDLKNRIIRTVGDAETRFGEDALRMLRALRFSAQLGFSVAPETLRAIGTCAPLCLELSAERVRDELLKTLLSPAPDTVGRMASLGLLRAVGVTSVAPLCPVPAERMMRLAAFFAACPEADGTRLRLDKLTAETARAAARLAEKRSRLEWKRVIAAHGEQTARCAAALCGDAEITDEIFASGECVRLRDLAVTGRDLGHLEGAAVGAKLAELFDFVLQFPEKNDRETLLRLLRGK